MRTEGPEEGRRTHVHIHERIRRKAESGDTEGSAGGAMNGDALEESEVIAQ